MRLWLLNEITVKNTDFSTFPTARTIFNEAKAKMLPSGVVVSEAAARVPLQDLLNHTAARYGWRLIIYVISLPTNKKRKFEICPNGLTRNPNFL